MTEIVTLEEAKAFMRIDPDYEIDDAMINMLISANREYLEGELAVLLSKQAKTENFRRCCGMNVGPVYLKWGPVIGLPIANSVTGETLDLHNSGSPESPRYYLTGSTDITYTAGYTPETVPQSLKLALLMLVATNYENRETYVIGQTVTPLSNSAMQLAYKHSRNLYF